MDPIRVIGRIDLAQQVHAALVAAGADARLITSAPMAVVAQTGRDGTGVDVLASAFDVCPAIKKAAQGRPVVMVTFDEPGSAAPNAQSFAASMAKTSRGPDAHLPWPATGAEILAACDRAQGAARVRRPRFVAKDQAIPIVALVMVGTLIWLYVASMVRGEPLGRWAHFVTSLLMASLLGASAWWELRRARTRRGAHSRPPWAIVSAALAVWNLIGGVLALCE